MRTPRLNVAIDKQIVPRNRKNNFPLLSHRTKDNPLQLSTQLSAKKLTGKEFFSYDQLQHVTGETLICSIVPSSFSRTSDIEVRMTEMIIKIIAIIPE
jgi:hypothetical protein